MYYLKGSSNADANTWCFLYKATNICFKVVKLHVSSDGQAKHQHREKGLFNEHLML